MKLEFRTQAGLTGLSVSKMNCSIGQCYAINNNKKVESATISTICFT